MLVQDQYGFTAWGLPALGDKAEAWGKLWVLAKKELTTEEINNKLLLAKNRKQQTAFHLVAEDGNTDALEKLWDWAKDYLTQEELHNKLLLAKDLQGQTALHLAVEEGYTEVIVKVCEWAKEEKLNLKYNLLLPKIRRGNPRKTF